MKVGIVPGAAVCAHTRRSALVCQYPDMGLADGSAGRYGPNGRCNRTRDWSGRCHLCCAATSIGAIANIVIASSSLLMRQRVEFPERLEKQPHKLSRPMAARK